MVPRHCLTRKRIHTLPKYVHLSTWLDARTMEGHVMSWFKRKHQKQPVDRIPQVEVITRESSTPPERLAHAVDKVLDSIQEPFPLSDTRRRSYGSFTGRETTHYRGHSPERSAAALCPHSRRPEPLLAGIHNTPAATVSKILNRHSGGLAERAYAACFVSQRPQHPSDRGDMALGCAQSGKPKRNGAFTTDRHPTASNMATWTHWQGIDQNSHRAFLRRQRRRVPHRKDGRSYRLHNLA